MNKSFGIKLQLNKALPGKIDEKNVSEPKCEHFWS